jgi:hypothetical protein
MLATIIKMKPEILDLTFHDGSRFRASDTFVRTWLGSAMEWSQRKATRAARKIPDDWEDKCEKSFFRKAYQIKEHDIPASLYVNSDQTNAVYAPGDKMTWAERGSKQVTLVGSEEKRAFTVMVSVTSDGKLLPFQAIYQGKSKMSCPSSKARYLTEAKAAGIQFEYSGTTTYWSNQQMMQSFVNKILAPYFDGEKKKLGLPETQCALWQIDVWSVHRSQEFRDWMRNKHPTILIDFVPGGCTGIHQPCDVGIQRPLKLSLKRSYHEDVVNQLLTQFDEKQDGEPEVLIFNETLGELRDSSVRWLWNAFNAVNKPNLVKKVSHTSKSKQSN